MSNIDVSPQNKENRVQSMLHTISYSLEARGIEPVTESEKPSKILPFLFFV